MKKLMIGLCALWCGCAAGTGERGFERAVRQSVQRQLEQYPESTLRDLYKNFFQDEFGPGHIIADTTAAGDYLRRELASCTELSGPLIEPLGWRHNYLRLNLSVIKEDRLSYPLFFDAFVRSVNGIEPPAIEEWTAEWNRIEAVIRSMDLGLPDFEADSRTIADNLTSGNYVGHHSERFNARYDPHYRIISREIFDRELLPFLGEYIQDEE